MSIEYLKSVQPSKFVEFSYEKASFEKGKIDRDAIKIETYNAQIKENKLILPEYKSKRISFGTLKGRSVKTIVKNLTSGFYKVTIVPSIIDIKESDRRYPDEERVKDDILEFWICYDSKKARYHITADEEAFIEEYQHIEDALYSDEVQDLDKKFHAIMERYLSVEYLQALGFKNIGEKAKKADASDYLTLFTDALSNIDFLKEYFQFLKDISLINEEEKGYIISELTGFEEFFTKEAEYIYKNFDIGWTNEQLVKENYDVFKRIEQSSSVLMVDFWRRRFFLEPKTKKVYRNFLEYDFQTQLVPSQLFMNSQTFREATHNFKEKYKDATGFVSDYAESHYPDKK